MENNIFDILKPFTSANTLNSDIKEIQNMIIGYFQNKYFSKIRATIAEEVTRQKTDPPDDIRLLYALKPYAKDIDAGFMDNIIEAAALAKTLGSIKDHMPRKNSFVKAASVNDASINPDGIYEIDSACKTSLASKSSGGGADIIPILAILALLFIKF